ncbi:MULTISPECIES: hypothetical protein [unclassified Streptomyces]|uniref:hypothetical protein n=1 Tax=unclassified Streptomyces TaxID=2593676 RepID=UPI001F271773|nr:MULTISPECIES: hypothetical protein [unclassified Streptomyces]
MPRLLPARLRELFLAHPHRRHPVPVVGLCRLCADGSTLRALRQADTPVDPEQRTVLEVVAAAMA